MNYPQEIQNFPITPHLDEICETLKKSKNHALILTAETGAGKSTVLPLALLNNFSGNILMTEPRRISVLGVANRVSSLIKEDCGQKVGYQIHLEKKISEKTRMQFVTEAILIKMLQEDQALEKYNVVVLDEFHERSIQMDLALAFLKEAMLLRDDLFVIIMSATIDCKKISDFLSKDFADETPVLKIPGKTFPVDIEYDDKTTIEKVIIKEAGKFLSQKNSQTLLAFLPGIAEIRRCKQSLDEYFLSKSDFNNLEIHILHSSVSLEEQKRILQKAPQNTHRVIISSAIAETSVTIPDVTVVVDSGLARINRLNIATGMEALCTEVESEFSAIQRSGRAGRIQAGRCIRLWNKFDPRNKNLEPEILRADLLNLVLECSERGIYNLEKIDWLDSPNAAGWKTSKELLQNLSCLDSEGKITKKGKQVLQLGISPRLACILLEGGTPQQILKYTNYNNSSDFLKKRFVEDLEAKLKKLNIVRSTECSSLLLYGFPDRLAKKITADSEELEFQFANGRKAKLASKENKTFITISSEWIIAPEVLNGKEQGIIYQFEEISNEKVNEFLKNKCKKQEICRFLDGKISKTENLCYGKIILESKKLPISSSDFTAAWVTEVKEKGISVLPLDEKIDSLLTRAKFILQQNIKCGQLDFGRQNSNIQIEDILAEQVEEWFVPFAGTSQKLTSQLIFDGLYWYLDGSELEKNAPTKIILPNGKTVKVNYEKLSSPEDKNKLVIRPVIEVIIQRVFGCFSTPTICGMKVLLRLLSPASRPLQVTDDLENFWNGAWIEICKEMKGRYPKHNWEYKIVNND